jgi:hypothetical protein
MDAYDGADEAWKGAGTDEGPPTVLNSFFFAFFGIFAFFSSIARLDRPNLLTTELTLAFPALALAFVCLSLALRATTRSYAACNIVSYSFSIGATGIG